MISQIKKLYVSVWRRRRSKSCICGVGERDEVKIKGKLLQDDFSFLLFLKNTLVFWFGNIDIYILSDLVKWNQYSFAVDDSQILHSNFVIITCLYVQIMDNILEEARTDMLEGISQQEDLEQELANLEKEFASKVGF